VIGGATYELSFLVALLAASWWAYGTGRIRTALVISILALGAKLLAVALVIPLTGILLIRDFAARKWAQMLAHFVGAVLLSALMYLPRFLGGMTDFIEPLTGKPLYHADLTRYTKLGAFLLRTGNLLGPLGVVLLVALLFVHRSRLPSWKSETGVLAYSYTFFLLAIMFTGPWEAYYLLPLVPLAFFVVLWLGTPRWAVVLFFVSALLGNVVQVQFKPWKLPPGAVHDGTIRAHLDRNWVTRGGG